MTLSTPWKAGAAASIAAIVAMAVTAAPAGSAELTEFSCGADTIHRLVDDLPVVFRKSGSTATGKVFLANTRLNARSPGAAIPVTVECVLDRSVVAKGTAIIAGRNVNAPVDGNYDMALRCTTRGNDGRVGEWEQNLTVPAPPPGAGPFDSPAVRAKFEHTACRSARYSLHYAR